MEKPVVIKYSNGGECLINPDKILYTRYYPKNTYNCVSRGDYGDGCFEVNLQGGAKVIVVDVDPEGYKKYSKKIAESWGFKVDEPKQEPVVENPLEQLSDREVN